MNIGDRSLYFCLGIFLGSLESARSKIEEVSVQKLQSTFMCPAFHQSPQQLESDIHRGGMNLKKQNIVESHHHS